MAVPRLKKYFGEIVPAMREQFGYANVMQVPRVVKVTLNMGIGRGLHDAKAMEEASNQLGQIAGQKPPGAAGPVGGQFQAAGRYAVGLRVTLRGDRMYELLDRLVSIALPASEISVVAPTSCDGAEISIWASKSRSFSGDESTQDRPAPGSRYRHYDYGEDRCRGRALLKLMGMPFRES